MRVYAINGVSLSGKDTFCNFVRNSFAMKKAKDPNMTITQAVHYFGGCVSVISTIDPIKEVYSKFFGWNGKKSDEHRKNLNTLKLIWIEASNGPSEWLEEKLIDCEAAGVEIVFVMVREFDEMITATNIARKVCGHGETVQLVRHGIPIPPIEQEFLNSHPRFYVYDYTIINPTTDDPLIPNLRKAANVFVELSETKTHLHNQVIWNPVDEDFFEWIGDKLHNEKDQIEDQKETDH